MGWQMPWYTLTDDFDIDIDFGVDGWHGTNAFIRLTNQAGERVFRSYSSTIAATKRWAALPSWTQAARK